MSVVEGNLEDYNELIMNDLVIVDFYATWCGPCKMLSPILEELASEREEISIVKIDVDKNQELSKSNGIMSVPTLIMFSKGELLAKTSGYMTKDNLITWIDENRRA